MALVANERVQNAVHDGRGSGGTHVDVVVDCSDGRIRFVVEDDGAGPPAGFDPARDGNLGLAIVAALTADEFSGKFVPERRRARTRATEQIDGDHYVLNGTKAGFSTNAGAAKCYVTMARTEITRPAFESTALLDAPVSSLGQRVGRKTELIGWKTAMHAEGYLDSAR